MRGVGDMCRHMMRRLWACLVARPTITADPQLAFMLLVNSTPKNIIATQDMAAILTDSFPTLDPASMTKNAFDCFEWYLQKVGPLTPLLSFHVRAKIEQLQSRCEGIDRGPF